MQPVHHPFVGPEVDLHDLFQIVQRGIHQVTDVTQHTRVQDHQIQTVDVGQQRIQGARQRLSVGQVQHAVVNSSEIAAATATAVHRATGAQQLFGQGAAQTRTRASDKSRFHGCPAFDHLNPM